MLKKKRNGIWIDNNLYHDWKAHIWTHNTFNYYILPYLSLKLWCSWPSEDIQDSTETKSVTKLGTLHLITAVLPSITYSSSAPVI